LSRNGQTVGAPDFPNMPVSVFLAIVTASIIAALPLLFI
jgi:hypothetical protein